MEFGLEFREEFLDAYMDDRVNKIGLHKTAGYTLKHSLRRGLKCKPVMYKVIRRELGVHWHSIIPKSELPEMTRRKAAKSFDLLCREYVEDTFDNGVPGIVVLEEKVPRSRNYGLEDFNSDEADIFEHRYVPVIPGLEKTVHNLVSSKNILDVVFLSTEEIEKVTEETRKRYWSWAKIDYFLEKNKISETKARELTRESSEFVRLSMGRLLLEKAKHHLILK
ncbi:MAG: hypothetical protein WCK29_00410 [archaeon]